MGDEVLHHQAAAIYRWLRQGDSEYVPQKLMPRFRQRYRAMSFESRTKKGSPCSVRSSPDLPVSPFDCPFVL